MNLSLTEMCIRDSDCTAHFIRTDLLTAGVLSNLRKVTSYAAKHEACLLYTSMEDYIRTKLIESLFKFRLDR